MYSLCKSATFFSLLMDLNSGLSTFADLALIGGALI